MTWRSCTNRYNPTHGRIIKIKYNDEVYICRFSRINKEYLTAGTVTGIIERIFPVEGYPFIKFHSGTPRKLGVFWEDLNDYNIKWSYIDKNEMMAFL